MLNYEKHFLKLIKNAAKETKTNSMVLYSFENIISFMINKVEMIGLIIIKEDIVNFKIHIDLLNATYDSNDLVLLTKIESIIKRFNSLEGELFQLNIIELNNDGTVGIDLCAIDIWTPHKKYNDKEIKNYHLKLLTNIFKNIIEKFDYYNSYYFKELEELGQKNKSDDENQIIKKMMYSKKMK